MLTKSESDLSSSDIVKPPLSAKTPEPGAAEEVKLPLPLLLLSSSVLLAPEECLGLLCPKLLLYRFTEASLAFDSCDGDAVWVSIGTAALRDEGDIVPMLCLFPLPTGIPTT